MLISKIKPATKTILSILQEKHNIFDIQEKVNLNLSSIRQIVVRLMQHQFVHACDSKLDDIRQRRLTYYQITVAGKEILKKINDFYGAEETDHIKKVSFSHTASAGKTKAFIKTLTKKATPWDGLLSRDTKNA